MKPESFWFNVIETANPHPVLKTPCWEWKRARHSGDGRGVVQWKGRLHYAHRVAWELTFGKEPEGILMHACDNPGCVRPEHLKEGSQKDNVRDAVEKRRALVGSKNGHNKLDEYQVAEIRRRRYEGETQQALASEFGVSRELVRNIVLRRIWTHIP